MTKRNYKYLQVTTCEKKKTNEVTILLKAGQIVFSCFSLYHLL